MRRLGWSKVRSLTALTMLVAGVATGAGAQARPVTSQQRIPVRKESGGEVARQDSIARADSIARVEAARRDSLARVESARQDSIARVEAARRDSVSRAEAAREAARRDSLAREDSIRNAAALAAAAAAQVPAALSRRGFYFGLAAGASSPTGDYSDPYETGWNITVPFGWQRAGSRWGIRGDVAYDSHGGKTFTSSAVPPIFEGPQIPRGGAGATSFDVDNGSIWSGNVDLTLDLAQWGANKLGAFYLIGGGGVHFFDKPTLRITPGTGAGAGVTTTVEGDSQTKFGLNGGAGLAFGVGRAALFLESRYFSAYTDNANSNWVPIIVGLKWF